MDLKSFLAVDISNQFLHLNGRQPRTHELNDLLSMIKCFHDVDRMSAFTLVHRRYPIQSEWQNLKRAR
ncbi:TPA: hypothetical protein DF272_01735 [Candidatus Falkowbacteria bacterium]|nr:hypothetical protein [Candidatus Falkowbacteria bacterium]